MNSSTAAFANLVGQESAVKLLSAAIERSRIAPAYLFYGPPGIGRGLAAKEFSALILAGTTDEKTLAAVRQRAIAGNHPDLLVVQPTYQHQGQLLNAEEAAAKGLKRRAAPQIRIEQIRAIAEFVGRPPLEAPRTVVIVEEAQTMAEAAANALLKTLEEPGRATLIAIAPGKDAILPTLVSRCQCVPFQRLSPAQVEQVLRQAGREEAIEVDRILLSLAGGSPGEAIAASEQWQAIPADLRESLVSFVQTGSDTPQGLRVALDLSAEIDKTLDAPAQLWLLDYLQCCYWERYLGRQIARSPLPWLEAARYSLQAYAQARLVWEATLTSLLLARDVPPALQRKF